MKKCEIKEIKYTILFYANFCDSIVLRFRFLQGKKLQLRSATLRKSHKFENI
jgi:hypothetical protein